MMQQRKATADNAGQANAKKKGRDSKMKKLLAMATSLALLATSAIVPMTAAAAEEKGSNQA